MLHAAMSFYFLFLFYESFVAYTYHRVYSTPSILASRRKFQMCSWYPKHNDTPDIFNF